MAKTREVRTDFHQDGVSRDSANTGHVGQVHTRDPKQFGLKIKRRLIVSALVEALLGSWWHLV